VSRPKLIAALYGYVKLLGIPVTFGKKVVDYWESLENSRAGVVTEQGEKFEADLVIAADGVGSISWKQTASNVEEPQSSGFSVYRVAYPTSLTYENPMLAEKYQLTEDDDDICNLFLGKNTHGIILVARDTTTWMLTHKVGESFPIVENSINFVLRIKAQLQSYGIDVSMPPSCLTS
jgi:2-polyprenyl-6-methoxyphenol hydroxylase-like FAD-dependent oxidoreductase